MEKIDPAKAAAVWQRVHSSTPPAQDGQVLLNLIHDELADGVVYQHLARQLQGVQGNLLQQMARQEHSHAACLKGMYQMITGTRAEVATPKYTAGTPEVTLRRCYGREMHCLAQYEARVSDPEYGKVFAQMAKQEQEHCRNLLELLGSLKTKP